MGGWCGGGGGGGGGFFFNDTATTEIYTLSLHDALPILAASIRGMVASPVKVKTRGGEELTIHFQREGDSFNEVWLEGNTSIVYEGRLNREAL